ncbi:MAG: hypothetical protein ACXVA9_06825 [Bdellovibrionales bacterium]
MEVILPDGYYWDNTLRLGDETSQLTKQIWPNFLIDESDIPEPGLKFSISVEELNSRFPVWGIRDERDLKLVAYAQAVLIHADIKKDALPDSGWRFACEALVSVASPNCLCLLAVNVDPSVKHMGFSQSLVAKAKLVTLEKGFSTMIGPVRPALKSEFPQMTMDEFLEMRSTSGEIFDPLVRAHVHFGGEVLNVCNESVLIKASLAKWQEWTGLEFGQSGAYELPQGLAPIEIDAENDLGVYREPNVWVRYRLRAATAL